MSERGKWEDNIWKRLQEELPITESDANDIIEIIKGELRNFAIDIFLSCETIDERANKKLLDEINILLGEKRIKRI